MDAYNITLCRISSTRLNPNFKCCIISKIFISIAIMHSSNFNGGTYVTLLIINFLGNGGGGCNLIISFNLHWASSNSVSAKAIRVF